VIALEIFAALFGVQVCKMPSDRHALLDLSPVGTAHEAGFSGNLARVDALLSEGVVVHIAGLGRMLGNAPAGGFVEIEFPLDDALLALDNPEFLTTAYQEFVVAMKAL